MSNALYNETETIIDAIDKKGWQSGITALGSAREAPTSTYNAYAFSAYHLALAANQLQDADLLEAAREVLNKAYWAYYTPSLTSAKHSELKDLIRSYRNVLMSHPRASEIEPVLLRMWEQSDPDAMNEQLVFDSKTQVDPLDTVSDTVKDVGAPFLLAAALWKGEPPADMNPTTFRMIQIGVYGGLTAAALGFTYLYVRPYLPKLPKRAEV